MLPLFMASWPPLVACLWDTATPQLAAAAAPLVGLVGALVASSRAAVGAPAAQKAGGSAAADDAATTTTSSQSHGSAALGGLQGCCLTGCCRC
jgi:hypothetical protein